ncbi:mitochondrial import inner membrane translocase subunit TIM17-2-like [Salvia miltiorrhiza]|uniref:mitochondrial import inner membrane translocase subunit TIM17-2-like n=1 Tax=Salvia miltiorrhiza TaxID=226208 RepID=UPI0025ACED60|nr:mitochondrial import inner membrane translocase subunit TIM17-2-like [Salvia miltiorrhiza]
MNGNSKRMEYPVDREPCPDRILDDVGGSFAMGAVGGSAFHFLRGVVNSPRGERFVGATQAVRMNVPRIGGSFAVWGGLYSTFNCSLAYLRNKEDAWNAIIAAASTGSLLQMRRGLRAASLSALLSGSLMVLIYGTEITLNKIRSTQGVIVEDHPPQEKKSGEILESFDPPTPPTFD